MNDDDYDVTPISLTWALLCMVLSLIVAIAANETVLPGKGKLIFLSVFVTAFVGQSIAEMASRKFVMGFLASIALVHAVFVAMGPHDNSYAGGLLFPIGIMDIAFWYLAFRWTRDLRQQ